MNSGTRTLRTALIFHSTCNDNLGVGALTVSEVEILRNLARELDLKLDIIILDSEGSRPPYVSGDDVDIRMVRELRQIPTIYKIYKDVDIVIDIGGGDSFSDIYGGKRLVRLLLLKYLALIARRPLVLAPQTMGPFKKTIFRNLARPIAKRAAIMATRDKMSTQLLRKMGVKRHIVEASDVAMKLPYDPPAERPAGGPVRVGMNISGLLMAGGYSGDNMFGLSLDYPTMTRALIEGFLAHEENCEIHLVPHVVASGARGMEDDYHASVELAKDYPGIKVAPAFASPSEAKTYIAGLDFFMGARMHACIAAFSSGVPVVPMAYSRKFAGLFGSLGYHLTVDCTGEPADAIQSKIFSAFDRREELAREIATAHANGLEKLGLYETALSELMLSVATGKGTA